MAKVDWNKHRETFAQLRAERGITAREYAEHYGLNINTARRELKKALLDDQESDQKGDQKGRKGGDQKQKSGKSDHNSGQEGDRKKGGNASAGKASDSKGQGKAGADTADHRAGDQKNLKTQKGKMITAGDDELPPIDHVKKRRGEGRKLTPGHEVRNRTGENAKPRQQDYEVADRLMSDGIEALATNALREAVAHMNTVQRSVMAAVEVLDQEIANREEAPPPDGEAGAEDAFGTHPTIKKAKLLMDAAYLYTTHTTMLSGVISSANKIDLERRKVEIAEGKAEITDVTATIISKAIQLRDEKGWDDIQTVEYIESFGIKAPVSLMARAAKAIQEMQPPVDDSANVSDDDLDAQAQEFAKQKREKEQFVGDRRDSVAQLVDELGVGDLDQNGDRRAGEFEVEQEHLDADYRATSALYNEDVPEDEDDDDPGSIAILGEDDYQ